MRLEESWRPMLAREMDSLTSEIFKLSLSGRKYIQEDVVLRSLNYKQRPVRHESIPDAHKDTFNWIFTGKSTGRNADLLKWLI